MLMRTQRPLCLKALSFGVMSLAALQSVSRRLRLKLLFSHYMCLHFRLSVKHINFLQ